MGMERSERRAFTCRDFAPNLTRHLLLRHQYRRSKCDPADKNFSLNFDFSLSSTISLHKPISPTSKWVAKAEKV